MIDPRDCEQKEKHLELVNASRFGRLICGKCSLKSHHGFGSFQFLTDPDKPEIVAADLFPNNKNNRGQRNNV